MHISLDVVIPTVRLQEQYLLPILQLAKPDFADLKFYIISDDPHVAVPAAVMALIDNKSIFLLKNEKNSGVAYTRNRGIETGKGDWILFLDDDVTVSPGLLIEYCKAICDSPQEIGFIGLVDMPPPPTTFAKAINVNGSVSVFQIAKKEPDFAWGATANVMVNRKAVGNVRFSSSFPNGGGGEDVEFLLKVRERNSYRNYKCLPGARVVHPWWNQGKAGFKRFYRYGIGNSFLAERNPRYTSRDFFNTTETLFLALIAGFAACLFRPSFCLPVIFFIAGTMLFEYIANIVRVFRATGTIDLQVASHVTVLKNIYEAGYFLGTIRRLHFSRIGQRFNFEGKVHHSLLHFNRYKIIKLVLYSILFYFMINIHTL